MIHRAELRSAHRTKRRILEPFFRQRLIVHGARRFRIERQLELLVPVEAVARPRQCVVAIPCPGPVPRQIRRMCELVDLEVVDLQRIRVGTLRLGDLPEGRWRPLTTDERAALLKASVGDRA